MNFSTPFGDIVLLEKRRNKDKSTFSCHCGNTFDTLYNRVVRGETKSCGCIIPNKLEGWDYSEGRASIHPLYRKWLAMKNRCGNKRFPCYIHIKVCPEWEESFITFYTWAIENGWKEDLTIDRIDPEKDYIPSNCRFITLEANTRFMLDWHKARGSGIYEKDNHKVAIEKAKANQGKAVELFDELKGTYHTFNTIGEGALYIKSVRGLDTNWIRIKSNLSACCLGKRKRCHNFTGNFI